MLLPPPHANACNKNQGSDRGRRLQRKESGWKQKSSVSRVVDENWNKIAEKNKNKNINNNNLRAVPLLSTHLLHSSSSSSSSSPLPLSRWLIEAARAPSHPSVLSLINQTIRLQLQLRRRRRWATSTFSRLLSTPPPRLPRTLQINAN